MRTFPEIPDVRVLREGWFQLEQDQRYQWAHDGRLHRITVRVPFCFDGASIPRIARVWLGRWDLGLNPPLFHDWLYRYRGNLPEYSHQEWMHGTWRTVGEPWSRRGADRLMGRMMREKGVPVFRRRMAYRAVRVGGWIPWLRYGEDWA